ncbi:MAG TPA: helix-turn-helix domain-containing protein [Candidatus Paceibacterota bacterium]
MSIKLLEQIGLNPEQAKVYLCLVSSGELPARKIALESRVNRSLVYKILKQLVELGLITENTVPGRVNTFTALHPSKLHSLIKMKEEDLKIADQALHEAVSTLGAQFNLACGKPSVRFYEGHEGIKILNKDILHTKVDIKLIRSPFDNNTEELDIKAKKLLEERARAGIKTKLIVPIKNTPSSITPEWDQTNLIERRRVPREELLNSAQVIIYDGKVAFSSFNDCMITTIIEDKGIADTCSMLFDALWVKYSENKTMEKK